MSRVICAGHVNWDVTLRVDRLPVTDGEARIEAQTTGGGGSAANVAATLSGLDVSASLLGSVGTDDRGRAARDDLTDAGVDCTHVVEVADAPTTVKYLVVDRAGEVMVFGSDGANERFEASALPRSDLAAADHLHLTSQAPETAAELARRANDAGVGVSFDPGRRIRDRDYAATLRAADFLLLNRQEASVALETVPSVSEGVLVVKRGADGAEVRTPERTYTHPGFDVDVADTTGAGDAFAAGFVAARVDGREYDRALAVANACGALATTRVGARVSIDRDAVEALLSSD
ncbi:carbohydrate kinase family protein [Salinirarus marinus]|uniref:carbohydrate kinase family protein n=1 Tax=Salinirarus marinus TaxID=3068310 RepID=UPI003C6C7EF8